MTKEMFDALDAYFRAVVNEKLAEMKGWDGLRFTGEVYRRREEVVKMLDESK